MMELTRSARTKRQVVKVKGFRTEEILGTARPAIASEELVDASAELLPGRRRRRTTMRWPRLLLVLLLMMPGFAGAQGLKPADILGREVELSLHDAIQLALENNLNLEVARTEPEVAEEGVLQATGAYDPFFAAAWGYEDAETPSANRVEDAAGGVTDSVSTESWNYNAGFQGTLPLGLDYSSNWNLTRTESSSGFFSLSPDWRAVWENELRIPLLKDLVDNPTDITVKRSRVASNLSIEDFRRQLEDEIREVERAYWSLTANLEARRVAEKSLETARSLFEQTQVQYEVGVVSRVAVTQAVAGVAERESSLIVARNLADSSQDNLLNRIVAPGPAGYASTTVLPESPTLVEYEVDLDETVRLALATRPELGVARARVEDAELAATLAANQRLPDLDLVGGYDLQGLSGSTKPPPPTPTFTGPSKSTDSMQDFFRASGDHSWSFRAEFSVPLPNTTARSVYAQRRIELRRARTNLRQSEQQVILEARRAARNLRSALEAIEAEERAKEAASESLRAEQERLRLGDSTPFDVLQFEEDLAEAENSLVRALQLYRNAITDLERAQGRLLQSRRIVLQEELERR